MEKCDLCQRPLPTTEELNHTAFALICNICIDKMKAATGQEEPPKRVIPQASLN